MNYQFRNFYINGSWVAPARPRDFQVINPATEEPAGVISMGSAADVERAVSAARQAFASYSQSCPESRSALLRKILEVYSRRYQEIADAMREEMGAPRASRAVRKPPLAWIT